MGLWSGMDLREIRACEKDKFLNLLPVETLQILIDETKSTLQKKTAYLILEKFIKTQRYEEK